MEIATGDGTEQDKLQEVLLEHDKMSIILQLGETDIVQHCINTDRVPAVKTFLCCRVAISQFLVPKDFSSLSVIK